MELLLSLPITRGRVVLEKFASMAVSTVVLALVVWVVLILGKYAIDMDIGVIRLGEMVVSLTLLGLAFGTVAFAIGSITGARGASVGVAAATAVAAYILDALGKIVDFVEPTKWISPFYYYNSGTPLVNGLNLVHVIVLLAIVMTCTAAAYFGFRWRDVRWQ
jgi:ABC-2 type transport system permease protein